MIDPDLKIELDQLNKNLEAIRNKSSPGIWRAFFNGMFGALGYLVGIVVVVAVVGWFLAKTGLIAPFQQQSQRFQTFMDEAENTLSATQPKPASSQQGSSQNGSYMITLPNGQKAQVTPQ
jgi:hypothetical protein